MAKGNMLLGKARGKVGSIVFYEMNGEQITRSYQSRTTNPQTQAQQINRVIMNTVTQAWKFLKPFCFYQGHERSEFRSLFFKWNIAHLRHRLAQSTEPLNEADFTPLSRNKFTYNEWDFVRGSLNNPHVFFEDTVDFLINLNLSTYTTYEEIARGLGILRGGSLNAICYYVNNSQMDEATEMKAVPLKIIFDPYQGGQPAPFDVDMFNNNDVLINANPNNILISDILYAYRFNDNLVVAQTSDCSIFSVFLWIEKGDGTVSNLLISNNEAYISFPVTTQYPQLFTTMRDAITKIEPEIANEIYLNNANS